MYFIENRLVWQLFVTGTSGIFSPASYPEAGTLLCKGWFTPYIPVKECPAWRRQSSFPLGSGKRIDCIILVRNSRKSFVAEKSHTRKKVNPTQWICGLCVSLGHNKKTWRKFMRRIFFVTSLVLMLCCVAMAEKKSKTIRLTSARWIRKPPTFISNVLSRWISRTRTAIVFKGESDAIYWKILPFLLRYVTQSFQNPIFEPVDFQWRNRVLWFPSLQKIIR